MADGSARLEKSVALAAMKTGASSLGGCSRNLMPPILGRKGVSPTMRFPCCDCGDVTTGEEVLQGAYVHVVMRDARDLERSLWRCECCQDELEDRARG